MRETKIQTIKVNVLGSEKAIYSLMDALTSTYCQLETPYKLSGAGISFYNLLITGDSKKIIQLWEHAYAETHKFGLTDSHAIIYCFDATKKGQIDKDHLKLITKSIGTYTAILFCSIDNDDFLTPDAIATTQSGGCRINESNSIAIKSGDKTTLDILIAKIRQLSEDYEYNTRNKLLDTDQYESLYRSNGGSYYRTKCIFGLFAYNSLRQISQTLKKRATKKPTGASAKTLEQFPESYRQTP